MKRLLFFYFLTITSICISQEIEYSTKKTRLFKEPFERTRLVRNFYDNEGGIYTIRHYREYIPNSESIGTTEGYIVQHWDKDLNSLSYKNYKLKIDKKGYVSDLFLKDEKLHVIEYVKNKKENTIDCYINIAIPQKTYFERKKMFSLSAQKFPSFLTAVFSNNVDNDYEGNVTLSENNDYIVFNIDSYAKEQEKHKLLVFNKNLELIWEKVFTHPTKDKLFDLVQIKIDNDGTVFILGRVYHEKRKSKKKGKVNFHFELFKITQDSTEITILENSNYFLKSLNINLNQDKLTCIGFISHKDDKKIVGSAFFSVDKISMNLQNSKFQQFSTDFMFDKYGDEDGFVEELRTYSIDNLLNLDDDGFIITAEEFYIDFNGGQYGNSVSYNFEDIIVFRLSKSGDLLWTRNLNKKQSSSGYVNRRLSYSTVVKNNNVYLFLNAHKKMGELSANRERFKSGFFGNINKNNSNLYLIHFDENGEWNSSIVQQNKNSEVLFDMNISEIKNPNNDKIMLFGSKDNNKQFLKIDIQ